MGDFLKELFSRLPDWFYTWAATLILLFLFGILIWFMLGAKRFADAMGRENRLAKLQEEFMAEKEKRQLSESISTQLNTVLENVQVYIKDLNRLRKIPDPNEIQIQARNLIQRVVEALSSDVKHRSGERHRCGVWLEDNGYLVLVNGSARFPHNYILGRKLDINRSLAGKAYRKKQTIKVDDVTQSDDWEPNPQSNTHYKSLICIPISDFAILTIDSIEPMNDHTTLIGELYSIIIEGALHELFTAYALSGKQEVASASVD